MPRTDFNGDGRDDVIWQNSRTGIVTNWLSQPNGSLILNSAAGEDPWAPGISVGIGDFNGDGRSDTLWRAANDEMFVSLTDPEGVFFFYWNAGFVATVPPAWTVAGTGDFNGDGRDDVLWSNYGNVSGFTTWLGRQDGFFDENSAHFLAFLSGGWQVAGTGDFNGDGRDDILWGKPGGVGLFTNWLGQTDGSFVDNSAQFKAFLGGGWQVAGTGDFNGDGRDDILWQTSANGVSIFTNWLGQANGSFVDNSAHFYAGLGIEWRVAGTGDYNGDGRDDILWRHSTGILTNWLAQADTSFTSNHAAAFYSVGLDWHIQPNPSGAGMWDY